MSTQPVPNPTPEIDPNPPDWLVNIISNMQKQADQQYADAVARYTAAEADWVTNANLDHMAGVPVPPFNKEKPGRLIYHAQMGRGFFTTTEYDPQLLPPVEPPNLIAPKIPNPFGTTTPVQDAANQQMMMEIYNLLAKIAAQMGIK